MLVALALVIGYGVGVRCDVFLRRLKRCCSPHTFMSHRSRVACKIARYRRAVDAARAVSTSLAAFAIVTSRGAVRPRPATTSISPTLARLQPSRFVIRWRTSRLHWPTVARRIGRRRTTLATTCRCICVLHPASWHATFPQNVSSSSTGNADPDWTSTRVTTWKSTVSVETTVFVGAPGRTRTSTMFPPPDF
jgi:hypothetical protein